MTGDLTAQVREFFSRAADGWGRWADAMQRDDAPRYAEAAKVAAGDRVLEIGAGVGEQTLVLAERVGQEGKVVATDLSPQMLDLAARRVAEAGFDNVEFISRGVDALDLQAASFDACISGFTWEFLADPVGAATRVRSLLVGGGRFVASVWAPEPAVPMRAVASTVIRSELGLPPPPPPEGLDLTDPREFERVLTRAGFEEVAVLDVPVGMRWESPDAYARWMREISPSLDDMIGAQDPERIDEIWVAVAATAADHVAEDDTVRMTNQAFLGIGVQPG